MSHTETKPKVNPELLSALTEFLKAFSPAENISEADQLLSTSDIENYLLDLLDEEYIFYSQINTVLKENGYRFQFIDGFKWLMKVKA